MLLVSVTAKFSIRREGSMTMSYFMLKKLEITADNFTLFLRITKNGFHNKMAKTVSVYLHASYYKRLLSFSCTTTTSV